MADSFTNPSPAPATPQPRCPHCDHVFAAEEIVDEWCEQCGKHIPEVLLKEIRPKPHLRNPHPHPLPEPTATERADAARENRVRAAGLFVMIFAIFLGLLCMAWGITINMSGESLKPVLIAGGMTMVVFLIGVGMFASGQMWE